MNEQWDRRAPWVPWAITSAALLAVAAVAYFIGLQSGPTAADGEAVRHAWRGAHVGPFWILLVLFWVFGSSRWLWGGPRWHYHPWNYGRYYGPWPPDGRDQWEQWHREAHRRSDGGTGSEQGREPRQP